MTTRIELKRTSASVALALAVGLLLISMPERGLAAAEPQDWCGCEGIANLGDFDSADPASWPTIDSVATVRSGNTILLPLPADGILVFASFTLDKFDDDENARLRFVQNDANTSVTLLVAGDVFIGPGGDLDLDGNNGQSPISNVPGSRRGGLPGPGGYVGGDGSHLRVTGIAYGGVGGGPGGGAVISNGHGYGGVWVGSSTLVPLVGGSGGAGGSRNSAAGENSNPTSYESSGGGGGGGALLLAVNGTATVDGKITANGGNAGAPWNAGHWGGGGAGGALRVLATKLQGGGNLTAQRGRGVSSTTNTPNAGSDGRIRIEALENLLSGGQATPPAAISGAPGPLTNPLMPSVAIASVDGVAILPPVLGWQGTWGAVDVIVAAPGDVVITVETDGVPEGTGVVVTVKPRVGTSSSSTLPTGVCDAQGVCSTDFTFTLNPGDYNLEARATFTVP